MKNRLLLLPACALSVALLTHCSDDSDQAKKKAQAEPAPAKPATMPKPVPLPPSAPEAPPVVKAPETHPNGAGMLPANVPEAVKQNEMVQKYLKSNNPQEREDAVVFAVSKCTSVELRPLLQAALNDASPAVRQRSLAMITGLHPHDQADMLGQAVLSPYPEIHESAIEDAGRLIGEFGERAWLPALQAGNQRAVEGMLQAFDRQPDKHWVDWMLSQRSQIQPLVQAKIQQQIAKWVQMPEGTSFQSLEQAAGWWAKNSGNYDNYMLMFPGKTVTPP
jgi:hypothetical protein